MYHTLHTLQLITLLKSFTSDGGSCCCRCILWNDSRAADQMDICPRAKMSCRIKIERGKPLPEAAAEAPGSGKKNPPIQTPVETVDFTELRYIFSCFEFVFIISVGLSKV